MSKLHVEITGNGPRLVLLHGWGMHGGVWTEVAPKLAVEFEVHSVDLPGYGYSNLPSPAGGGGAGGEGVGEQALSLTFSRKRERELALLDVIVEELSSAFPDPVAVCGWSLGGQVALHWAMREPEKIRRLILVSSTPCFVARDDWACAMDAAVFEKFASELEQNHAATLRRFISLQLRGSENERELMAMLRERLFSRGEPDMAALRAGLNILRAADQRKLLERIKQPTLVIAGERDKLTPPEASHYMAQTLPAARMVEVQGAAHAPFLSHPELFVDAVKDFLKAKND